MTSIKLIEKELPNFGVPKVRPDLPTSIYRERLDRFIKQLRIQRLSAAVIYADREHFANLAYLTGFEPRFEEALAVIVPGRDPVIVTGPENQGYAKINLIDADIRLYQPFGLLGQDRSGTPPLAGLFGSLGLGIGMTIGIVGWKYFSKLEAKDPDDWIDAPSYLVDALRAIVAPSGRLSNATALFMGASTGLRAVNEIAQIAQFEFSASHASEAIKRVLFGIKPGMREYEAAQLMNPIGLPLSCHPMLSTGTRAYLGLASPTDKVVERGEPFTMALGLWGALTCRAGWLVENAEELPAAAAEYLTKLAIPYFSCVAEWYETIGIGIEGRVMDELVKRHLGDAFFGVFLNPGHLIHLDEWMNTPIYPGSTEVFRSGQAIQVDIIPATNSPYFTINIEDGIALLDERGRAEFADRYPEAWRRIIQRRAFFADEIGIRLKEEVLPLSNLPAYLAPFILAPKRVLARS